ncbi:MAG: DUF308 domain-containing protein [Holdemanella sp.]|nr:DUF308 domain-containing protein [Holdemanella sp.]
MKKKRLSISDTIILAILFIICGVLLCFFNVNILLIAARIVGIALLLIGIYFLYVYFKKRISTSTTPFFLGIPSAVIGIFMLASPESVIAILPILIGTTCIVNSIISMQKTFIAKDANVPTWKISLVIDILFLFIGVIMLLKPIQALTSIIRITGVVLIAEAFLLLWTSFQLKETRKIEKNNTSQ